jgi:nicotinamide/nicotinate riboside kinase
MSEAAGHGSQTAIIGLSGPSSSGKTTMARLLRAVFDIPASAATRGRSCSLTIIHQDDFYKTDAE